MTFPSQRIERPGLVVTTLSRKPEGVTIYSPSQTKSFQDCERYWGFQKLDGIRTPSSPSQALGTTTHTVAEDWLTRGTVPDESQVFTVPAGPRYPGRIFKPGIKHLPAPGTALVEQRFYMRVQVYLRDRWVTVYFTGFIDCVDQGERRVIDHKTTTSFRWMLQPDDLRQDYQAIIYAVAGLVGFGWDEVTARWIYYVTHGRPQVKLSEHRFTLDEALSSFVAPLLVAAEMQTHRSAGKTGADMTPNYGHCSNYGGCFFRDKCFNLDKAKGKVAPGERIAALMSNDTQSFNLEAFVKDRLGTTQETPAPPPPPPQEQAPPPPPPPQEQAQPDLPPPPPPPPPAQPEALPPPPAPEPASKPAEPDAAPPPPPPVPAVEAAPTPEPVDKPLVVTTAAPPPPPQPETPTVTSDIAAMDRKALKAELLAAGVIESSCRFGIPRLQEMLVAHRAAQEATPPPPPPTQEATPPPPPPTQEATPPPPPPTPEPPEGRQGPETSAHLDAPRFNVLFVDCMPMVPSDDSTIMFSKFLAPLMDEISPDSHYRLHPDAGFGKASALICQRVEEELRSLDPKTSIIASMRIAEHRDCMQVLEAAARLVVKSF